MKFRNSLSLQFTFMFAFLLFTVLGGIYLMVKSNRSNSFFSYLDERALIAAQFYFAEDNLSIKKFRQVTQKFPQSLSQETISIYDDEDRPHYLADTTLHWGKQFLDAIRTKQKIHLHTGARQVSGLYYEDNSGNFIIIVSAIDERGFHDMKQLRIIMSVVFFTSLFITFFIGRVFANISLRPLVGITDKLKYIRASNLHQRLPVSARQADEVDNLSLSINQLLENLEQSFSSQQSFVANASHELRTPITAILGEAETTLMKERSPEEYRKALQEVVTGVNKLNFIINSLMELMHTSLDNRDFQRIVIGELMWEVADELEARNGGIPVPVSYELPEQMPRDYIQGNRRLLFIAISNILKNALKFSEGNPVICKVQYKEQGIEISIADKGVGIGEADLPHIFQPFFRSANAINFPGYGIGLSLTYNIVRLHNGTIQVLSEINKGTRVVLFFPFC